MDFKGNYAVGKKRGNGAAEQQRHQLSVTALTEEGSNGTAARPSSKCLICR